MNIRPFFSRQLRDLSFVLESQFYRKYKNCQNVQDSQESQSSVLDRSGQSALHFFPDRALDIACCEASIKSELTVDGRHRHIRIGCEVVASNLI